MMESEVAVVIINWKLPQKTMACLHSLTQLEMPHYVVVVDNGSDDQSAMLIQQAFPHIMLIQLAKNIGFGAACNVAIEHILKNSSCNYILLLNNDTLIHPKALTALIQAATAHPAVGILGPKIYSTDQPQMLWYAGARCRRGVLAATDTGRGEKDWGQFDARREVDFVFGAAMLIRREVFASIGLFDQQFFLYLEDLDFCLRARQANFKLHFVPQAHVWHDGSASTQNNTSFRRYHHARSTVLFLKKHVPFIYLPTVLSFWSLVLARALLWELWRGNTAVIRSYWSGFCHALISMRRL